LDIEALGREQLRLIGVPEDELKGVSAEDAMAWCGRVLGFEHGAANGAANCEAQGREQLRQIGVPEDELEGASAEDAMAHVGQVLGFEHGAANLEAQGREMLRLIGVPEDELESAPAPRTRWRGTAWCWASSTARRDVALLTSWMRRRLQSAGAFGGPPRSSRASTQPSMSSAA
jgi:hypothetical protein